MPTKKAFSKVGRRRVIFSYHAPEAAEVIVAGDFNGWDTGVHAMKRELDGTWKKILMLFPGRYEYKFLVDGRWCTDPLTGTACANVYGTYNNVLEVAAK